MTWSATGGTIDQEGRFSAEEIGDLPHRGAGRFPGGNGCGPGRRRVHRPGHRRAPAERLRLARHGSASEVDELLHEGPIASRLHAGTEAARSISRFPPVTQPPRPRCEAAKAALRDLGYAGRRSNPLNPAFTREKINEEPEADDSKDRRVPQ